MKKISNDQRQLQIRFLSEKVLGLDKELAQHNESGIKTILTEIDDAIRDIRSLLRIEMRSSSTADLKKLMPRSYHETYADQNEVLECMRRAQAAMK